MYRYAGQEGETLNALAGKLVDRLNLIGSDDISITYFDFLADNPQARLEDAYELEAAVSEIYKESDDSDYAEQCANYRPGV